MTENNSFISNQFETWDRCKKMYYLKYIKNLYFPDDTDYSEGRNFHALVNYYLKGFNVEIFFKNIDESLLSVWERFKSYSLENKKLIVSEWDFNSKIGDTKYWLTGRIDAVFFDTEKSEYIIVDWKTGTSSNKPMNENYQCMAYLYSFYNAYRDLNIELDFDNLSFEFVNLSECFEIRSLGYSKKFHIEFENNFISKINEINTFSNYKDVDNCNDRFCNYKKLCIS